MQTILLRYAGARRQSRVGGGDCLCREHDARRHRTFDYRQAWLRLERRGPDALPGRRVSRRSSRSRRGTVSGSRCRSLKSSTSSSVFKTHRCLVCRDWWSGVADVSISDGDPNIYASSRSGARSAPAIDRVDVHERRREVVKAAVGLGLASGQRRAFVAEGQSWLQRKRFRYVCSPRRNPTGCLRRRSPTRRSTGC